MDPDVRKKKKKRGVVTRTEYVPRQAELASPYVAIFPSGFDPLQKVDNEEDGPRVEFASYLNTKPLSRQQELVARTQDGVDFVGSNYVGEAAVWQPCDYLLGVFDKKKGSLKLLPLAGEKVFRMEPRVRGLDYGRVIDGEVVEEEGDTLELGRIKRKMLTEAFGSQKRRRWEARYERAQVKEDDVGNVQGLESLFLDAAKSDVQLTAKEALAQANSFTVQNIPPHDLTATTPQTAYPLDKIISPDEWEVLDATELLSAAQNASLEKSLNQSKTYPAFVLNRLKKLRIEGDTEGNHRRAQVLLYMKHLLKFHCAPHGHVRMAADPWDSNAGSNTVNLTVSLGIPEPIVAKFLEIFTMKGVGSIKAEGCQRNSEHMQRSTSYLIVLGLTVDDFESDLQDLATELKMTVSTIKPHYLQLGCKLKQSNGVGKQVDVGQPKWTALLPVPLKFPKLAPNSSGRGRRLR